MKLTKRSGNIEFDILYADNTKRHEREGVLFSFCDEKVDVHIGTSRPECLFSIAEALLETISSLGIMDAFEKYIALSDEELAQIRKGESNEGC